MLTFSADSSGDKPMIEADVQNLIAQAEKQSEVLIAATKKQIESYQALAERAESEEEQKRYLLLAAESSEKSQELIENMLKRIAAVREQLARSSSSDQ